MAHLGRMYGRRAAGSENRGGCTGGRRCGCDSYKVKFTKNKIKKLIDSEIQEFFGQDAVAEAGFKALSERKLYGAAW